MNISGTRLRLSLIAALTLYLSRRLRATQVISHTT